MINLLEEKNRFDKSITKNLPMRGRVQKFDTYKIPLKYLRYNVRNDRIATFITQYTDETGELPTGQEEFNSIIEDFIVESNPDALDKTKKNIKALGQIEPAVVMADGVVIDGNRRFTALRQLYKEESDNKFDYLEAVILPLDVYDYKEIKRLELNLQHAIESKVDYSPIERLVGVYRDLIQDGHPFTVEEYAAETQISKRKVNEEVEIAKLLVEYLNYINQPGKFHIARRQKIDGPLREVYKILRSKKIDDFSKDDVKEFLFSNMLSMDGDLTRGIRALKPVMENPKYREEILEEAEDYLDDISDKLADSEVIKTGAETGIINVDIDTRENLNNLTEKHIDNNKLSDARNQPVDVLKKSLERLKQVDKEAVKRFDQTLKNEFKKYLEVMEQEVDELKEFLNDQ